MLLFSWGERVQKFSEVFKTSRGQRRNLKGGWSSSGSQSVTMKLLEFIPLPFHPTSPNQSSLPPSSLILQLVTKDSINNPCMYIDCKWFLKRQHCQTACETRPVMGIDSRKALNKFDSPLQNCEMATEIPLALNLLHFPIRFPDKHQPLRSCVSEDKR